jgi:hypothetical protein
VRGCGAVLFEAFLGLGAMGGLVVRVMVNDGWGVAQCRGS